MNYLNITKYIYLVLGFVMTYDAYDKYQKNVDFKISLFFSALAFFLFFFRNYMMNKAKNRNADQQ